MKKGLSLAVFAILVLTACGGTSSSDSNPDVALATVPAEYAGLTNPFGEEAAVEGVQVFRNYCVSCHGESGKGDGVAGQSLEPMPKDLSQVSAVAGDDFLFWRISNGSPGTAMIGWNGILDEEQIWQVVAYIRTLE